MSVDPSHVAGLLALEQALGASRVNSERATLETFAKDESETETVLPIAVVHVRSTEDVAKMLRVCNALGLPVVPRAAGTGMPAARVRSR